MCGPEDFGPLPEVADAGSSLPRPVPGRQNLAVASSTGRDIDLHLGQAQRLLIYGPRGDGRLAFLGSRPLPEAGSGASRWSELAARLTDCFVLLAAEAGPSPRSILASLDIPVLTGEGRVSDALTVLYDTDPHAAQPGDNDE